MSSTEKVRSTIKSTEKTMKITGAMELVAASKLGKTQRHMAKTKPFSEKILEVMGHIATSHSEYQHPFLVERKNKKNIGYIVVSSDRGLCGSLNLNLFKEIINSMKSFNKENIKMCLIGNKATAFFSRINDNIIGQKSQIGDRPSVTDTLGVVKVMLNAYLNEEVDAIYLCFNKFKTTMVQNPTIIQLTPLLALPLKNNADHWDYIYEPDAKEVIDMLLERYLESLVHQAVIENIACEQAARMIAMKSATDNAIDIIEELKLLYNKARQAAITQELAEIIGGAGAV
ncbi:MAG: F0F1 ATP synthase subunit gamma [Pseudomonadota bacterium]|nr:F0F1 ATP synthase subunit gamma [Pseudomonadota bacterium]